MKVIGEEIEFASQTARAKRIKWSRLHRERNVSQSSFMNDLMSIFNLFYKDIETRLKGINSRHELFSQQFDEQLVELKRSHPYCNRTQKCNETIEEIHQAKQLMMDRLQDFIDAEQEREKIMASERAAYGKISQECKI